MTNNDRKTNLTTHRECNHLKVKQWKRAVTRSLGLSVWLGVLFSFLPHCGVRCLPYWYVPMSPNTRQASPHSTYPTYPTRVVAARRKAPHSPESRHSARHFFATINAHSLLRVPGLRQNHTTSHHHHNAFDSTRIECSQTPERAHKAPRHRSRGHFILVVVACETFSSQQSKLTSIPSHFNTSIITSRRAKANERVASLAAGLSRRQQQPVNEHLNSRI